MKELNERKRELALTIATNAFVAGQWTLDPSMSPAAAKIAARAKELVESLDASGCLDEKFGESGSLEATIAKTALNFILPDHEADVATQLFTYVRNLANDNRLSDAERNRSRVVEIDREKAEEEAERAKQAEAERKAAAEAKINELNKQREALERERDAIN